MEPMTGWIVTEAGYAAALDLAARMGTDGAQQYADARRPGTRLPNDMEVPERWFEWGWVQPPGGQLTLF